MQITPEQTLRIQSFLFSNGFIQEKPSDTWTPHKHSGYKLYLESKGLPESECREVPYNLGMLVKELRDYILIPDKVTVVSDNEVEIDELETPESLESLELTETNENTLETKIVEPSPSLKDTILNLRKGNRKK